MTRRVQRREPSGCVNVAFLANDVDGNRPSLLCHVVVSGIHGDDVEKEDRASR